MRLEHWWFTAPLRLRSVFRRGRVEDEMDEELRFHLEHKIDEGIAEGLSPAEARRRALKAMGGLEQRKEEIRDARRVHWLTDFVDDVRYATRSLRRTPWLSAFIVVTIAVGIGMTATPLSMLDALIFRPYPVPHPGRVVTLVGTTRDDAYGDFSHAEYLDIRDHAKSYEGVIASTTLLPVGFAATPGATPQVRGGQLVSGNYFQVLGVNPQLGRAFREDEDRAPGRDAVVVLAPDFWRRDLGADPSAVGRTIRLNGADFTVVGVAPDDFPGMYIFSRPDFYVPLAMAKTFSTNPEKSFFTDRDDRELTVRARLRHGVSLLAARNELAGLARNLASEYPKTNRDRGAAVHTQFEMRTRANDLNWKFSVIFTILALAVLLVACTNVAGLLLSRARSRTREIAVRLAIGAGRSRLLRMLLTESLVLALLGGLAGVAVAYAGIHFMASLSVPAELPVRIPFQLDLRVLLATVALSLLSALACGLAPALQSTRTNLVSGLKSSESDDVEGGPRRLRGRSALVAAQIAMSLMLLTAAFLMYRGFHNALGDRLEVGKDTRDHVLMTRFDPRLVQYDAEQTRRFYRLLGERARQIPGVTGAAFTQDPPLALDGPGTVAFVPDGLVMPRDREAFTSFMDSVDEGYFETLSIPILSGRGFRASDTADSPRVAVVNELFARHYWPKGDAVGKRIRLDRANGTPVEIVGIAQTLKYRSTFDRGVDFLYLPFAQHPAARMVLLLRTDGDPLQLLDPIRRAVHGLDANMPMLETRTYADLYRYATVEGPGMAIKLVATLGTVGLLLAIAGLYGLVAYNVSRRTREIGIRIAIGARPGDVIRLVMGKGLALVATGTVIGLALGFALERLMDAMLFNSGGTDVVVYLVLVPAMAIVTMLAAYVPARRATRIPPTLALRCE